METNNAIKNLETKGTTIHQTSDSLLIKFEDKYVLFISRKSKEDSRLNSFIKNIILENSNLICVLLRDDNYYKWALTKITPSIEVFIAEHGPNPYPYLNSNGETSEPGRLIKTEVLPEALESYLKDRNIEDATGIYRNKVNPFIATTEDFFINHVTDFFHC